MRESIKHEQAKQNAGVNKIKYESRQNITNKEKNARASKTNMRIHKARIDNAKDEIRQRKG